MNHLNYQHLQYFWVVAREGSIVAASETLNVSASTISVQIKKLEAQFDQALFRRVGRGLELSDVGRVAFRFADSIFSTGQELQDYLEGRGESGTLRLNVGVAHVFPKLVTWRLLEPATQLPERCHIVCREASPRELVEALLLHQLDVVFSDVLLTGGDSVRLFHRLLEESTVSLFAAPELASQLRPGFPQSLDGADLVLPTNGTEMRRSLDGWFNDTGIQPIVAAEFDDLALLKVAGEHGLGVIPIPDLIGEEAQRHYGVERIGTATGVIERFYAVSAERQIEHPAVVAIERNARPS